MLHRTVGASGAQIITYYCGISRASGSCLEDLLRHILVGSITTSSVPPPLLSLFERHNIYITPRRPSVEDLETTVLDILGAGGAEVYLVVDALDEVVDAERVDVVDFLLQLASRSIDTLHLLLVNRSGTFLRRLQASKFWKFDTIPKDQVQQDIARFVKDNIRRHDNLDALEPELQAMILGRLAGHHNDQTSVGSALRTLPKDLNDTYEHILLEVDKTSEDDGGFSVRCATTSLRVLTFAWQPLYVEEFLDHVAMTIFTSGDMTDEWQSCRISPVDLLRLLPGMVHLSPEPDWTSLRSLPSQTHLVSLEHFSVREYLTGMGIMYSSARRFALESSLAHRAMAEACILCVGWTYFTWNARLRKSPLTSAAQLGMPRMEYDWVYWAAHLERSAKSDTKIEATNATTLLSERRTDIEAILEAAVSRGSLPDATGDGYDTFRQALNTPLYSSQIAFIPLSKTASERLPIIHQRLDPDHFRLLELAGQRFPQSPLCGSLFVFRIHAPPKYAALSYSWGAGHASSSIFISSVRHSIGGNLSKFLQAVSRNESHLGRYVWADALCIDQANMAEKSVQIKLMPHIARNAAEVIVGLGQAPGPEERWLLDGMKRTAGSVVVTQSRPTLQTKAANVILAFLQRRWFSLTWTLPELLEARAVSYVFEDGVSVASREMNVLFENTLDLCSFLDGADESHEAVAFLTDPSMSLQVSSQSSHSFVSASCRWDLARLSRDRKQLEATQLLYGTRYRQSSEPRDRFLALFEVEAARLPQNNFDYWWKSFDYRCDHSLIMEDFGFFLASEYGILGLMAEASEPPDDATRTSLSWVSVMTMPKPRSFIPLLFNNLHTVEESLFMAGGYYTRQFDWPHRRALSTRGKLMATIEHESGGLTDRMKHLELEVVERYKTGRHIAYCSGGRPIALVPKRARKHDQIYILPGFRVPYVLRANNHESKTIQGQPPQSNYTFVGEA
ncbi:uncharacterized protein LTR77_005103 [Saxophila tyrrhenica]|uniref:Heterokaryon incompatibility domain-containing protein n=1 Tax=Saxophila tyrrhenica TaxID=1690608 RepID=A0AAV9PBR3_9PEZI|nr:hypothetical protein LTR77_005103 [Saxophila tyrrhenica]